MSLGIPGSITEKDGFIPIDKKRLRERTDRTYSGKEVFALEYGYAKWLMMTLDKDGTLSQLKTCFPNLW